METLTLSEDQKLLAIHLVIQIFIKPSNEYYRNAVTRIQRFWRKRSGYYGFKPLAECKITNTFCDRYPSYIPPRLKRSMACCSGDCLSQQQRKRNKVIQAVHDIFSEDIHEIHRNYHNPLSYKIPYPVDCICNNYENFKTLQELWTLKNCDHLRLKYGPESRRQISRFGRNRIYLILAQDKISWFTRNTIINFLKSKNIIS